MASPYQPHAICHLLVLAWLMIHIAYCFNEIDIDSESQHGQWYRKGSLSCKLYNVTSLDCSHRKLELVPTLQQQLHLDNNITKLLLNHNKITNLTGTPFSHVSVSLRVLYLTYNLIHSLEPSVFSGLSKLQILDLSGNQIVTLPCGIFRDLHYLQSININMNRLETIPNEALAPLVSIEHIGLVLNYFRTVRIGQVFQNFTKLHTLAIVDSWLQSYQARFVGSLKHLADCQLLKTLIFSVEFQQPLSANIFERLTHLESLYVSDVFEFEDIVSLSSPLKALDLYPRSLPKTISNDTLQPLSKWNSTLSSLRLKAGNLEGIEDGAFAWIPSLRKLDLTRNSIKYLSGNAFDGLSRLELLNMSDNSLSFIPYQTFQVFWTSESLLYLDLSSNQLSSIESDWSLLSYLITPSLEHLNVDGNYAVLLNTSVLATRGSLTDVTIKIKDVIINSPPVYSLRTLRLQAYSSPATLSPYSFQTAICTFAPFLERALLPNILIRTFSDVIGDSCPHLTELDISGCLTEYTIQPIIYLPKLTTLNMSKNKITSLNQISFLKSPQLLSLDLSYNELSSIGTDLEHLFESLVSLNLEGNKLTSMHGFRTSKLRYLNLAQNQITHVPSDFQMNTTYVSGHEGGVVTLDLSGNPFQCTCEVVSFRQWIAIDNVIHLLINQMYTCATPNSQKGRIISEVVLDCRSHLAVYLSSGILSGLLVMAIAVLLVKYRWHIKYKMFLLLHSRRRWRNMDDVEDETVNTAAAGYDAYVAYNDNCRQDIAWVINDLHPNMEDKQQLKLCIKDRDFLGGRDIFDEIFQNIQRSRKTLLILTPRFVESEWCHFEMRMAQMRLFDENRDVLILVLLEEIPDNMLTISLRQLLCEKELLKFPHDGLGQELFWRRLKAEILEPVIIDRRYDV